MARGPKPTPQPTESGLLTRTPPAPEWLPPHGKKVWKRTARHLVERRVLAATDLDTLMAYTVAVANIQTIMEGNGTKQHGTLSQNMIMQARYAGELGLTPASRQKVGTEPSDQDDDLADLGL